MVRVWHQRVCPSDSQTRPKPSADGVSRPHPPKTTALEARRATNGHRAVVRVGSETGRAYGPVMGAGGDSGFRHFCTCLKTTRAGGCARTGRGYPAGGRSVRCWGRPRCKRRAGRASNIPGSGTGRIPQRLLVTARTGSKPVRAWRGSPCGVGAWRPAPGRRLGRWSSSLR